MLIPLSPNTLPTRRLIINPSRKAFSTPRTIKTISVLAGVAVGVDPDGASIAGTGFGRRDLVIEVGRQVLAFADVALAGVFEPEKVGVGPEVDEVGG